MVDITQPTIMGYEITPWFIVWCLSIIATVVFAIVVIMAFSKRGAKEKKIIESVVRKTSDKPYINKERSVMDLSMAHGNKVELVFDKKEELPKNAIYAEVAEEVGGETEALEQQTETLERQTEAFKRQTELLRKQNEALKNRGGTVQDETEVLDTNKEDFQDETEVLDTNKDDCQNETEVLYN